MSLAPQEGLEPSKISRLEGECLVQFGYCGIYKTLTCKQNNLLLYPHSHRDLCSHKRDAWRRVRRKDTAAGARYGNRTRAKRLGSADSTIKLILHLEGLPRIERGFDVLQTSVLPLNDRPNLKTLIITVRRLWLLGYSPILMGEDRICTCGGSPQRIYSPFRSVLL